LPFIWVFFKYTKARVFINKSTHYNHPTTTTPAPNTSPQVHAPPKSLATALAVNVVPLYDETPVVAGPFALLVDVPKPPSLAIIPAKPLVIVLPKNALNASVFVPPTTTDDPSLISDTAVPETVIAAPPATSVCEPDATIYSGVLVPGKALTACVVPPMAIVAPFEARETVVPETVNWPPGVKV
jgi:hypothetical protein